MTKQRSAEDLIDFCEEESLIECQVKGCKEASSYNESAEFASEHFFEQGWRATPTKVYCPEHAKKSLK